MNCKRCGSQLRIAPEQVAVDKQGMPIYHRFGYCDNCRMKYDMESATTSNTNQKKKNSTLSVIAAVLGLFGCTVFIGAIIGIVDLCQNDKTKKHLGSWFAIISSIIVLMVAVFIGLGGKGETNNTVEDKPIVAGDSVNLNDLIITFNNQDLEYTSYNDEYNLFKPKDGMKYIKTTFTFENKGESDRYVSIYDFNCYADDNACEQVYLPDDIDFINTNLSSGKKVTFNTYYQVPINVNKIELEYDKNIFTNDKIIFKIQ